MGTQLMASLTNNLSVFRCKKLMRISSPRLRIVAAIRCRSSKEPTSWILRAHLRSLWHPVRPQALKFKVQASKDPLRIKQLAPATRPTSSKRPIKPWPAPSKNWERRAARITEPSLWVLSTTVESSRMTTRKSMAKEVLLWILEIRDDLSQLTSRKRRFVEENYPLKL